MRRQRGRNAQDVDSDRDENDHTILVDKMRKYMKDNKNLETKVLGIKSWILAITQQTSIIPSCECI